MAEYLAELLNPSWSWLAYAAVAVVQSMRIIRKAMEKYGSVEGSIGEPIKVGKKLPVGEAYLETEAPKGQLGYMIVSNGMAAPWRVRIRSSTFCNLSVTAELCRGMLIGDIPAIVGSLDLVLGEIDR